MAPAGQVNCPRWDNGHTIRRPPGACGAGHVNFSCDKCQKKYSVPDERAAGRLLRVRCKGCGHLIQVQGPPLEDDEEEAPTRAASLEQLLKLAKEKETKPKWES